MEEKRKYFSVIYSIFIREWSLLIGGIVGIFFIVLPIVGYNFDYFPGDIGDGHFNLYILEHAHRFFIGGNDSFWNAPFMFPEPNIISYSDNLLGTAPIYSFFRVVGYEQFTAYQLWVVTLFLLNYLCAYFFLKKLIGNSYAAVLGAMVFAFSLALQSQVTHVQTFPRFPIPLAFLAAIHFYEKLNPGVLFLTILFLVYQIYCGIYLGFFLAIPLGFFLLLVFIGKRKDIIRLFSITWISKIIIGVLVNIALLLPVIYPYMNRGVSPSWERYYTILNKVPVLKSFFFSKSGTLIWGSLNNIGSNLRASWDHQLFAGGIVTIIALVFVVIVMRKLIKGSINFIKHKKYLYLLLSAVVTFLLYIRIDNLSFYFLVYFLPGFGAIRAVTRIINIELLFFAISTSYVFLLFFNKIKRYTALVFILILALFVVDNYTKKEFIYNSSKSESLRYVIQVADLFNQVPDGAVISYEPISKEFSGPTSNLIAMLASQYSDNIVVNGYTAICPGYYIDYWNTPNEASRNKWLNAMCYHIQNIDSIYVVKGYNNIESVSVSVFHE